MKNKIMIAVMSYNRDIYLNNCIKSIEKNIKNKDIYIFDDNRAQSNF
jgi:GT2 family glycosyltransferase